jgi:fermentation-respiration switch protein FrsA (DUF1100 family)
MTHKPGSKFLADRLTIDVPQAYCSLDIPKLQIQGSADLPGFRQQFLRYYNKAGKPKKYVLIRGADHVFSQRAHRTRAITLTRDFFTQTLRDHH